MTEKQDLSFTTIERNEELRFVDVCLQRKLNCLIVGPAGVGKTTLLRYVVKRAASIDIRFRSALVDCSGMRSLGELLQQIIHKLTPDSKGSDHSPPTFADAQSSARSMSEHMRLLLAQREVVPLVCLDSLDCLPEHILAELGRPLMYLTESESIVFAATRDASPPLPSWLVNRFQTLYLGPLSAEAVHNAIQKHFTAIPADLTGNLVQRIAQLSGGHPLILKLILDYLTSSEAPIQVQLSTLESRLQAALPTEGNSRHLTPGQWALKSSKVNEAMLHTLLDE